MNYLYHVFIQPSNILGNFGAMKSDGMLLVE